MTGLQTNSSDLELNIKDLILTTNEFSGLPENHYLRTVIEENPKALQMVETSAGNHMLVCANPEKEYLLFATRHGAVLALYNRISLDPKVIINNPGVLEKIYQTASSYLLEESKGLGLGKNVNLAPEYLRPIGIYKHTDNISYKKRVELAKHFFGLDVSEKTLSALKIEKPED